MCQRLADQEGDDGAQDLRAHDANYEVEDIDPKDADGREDVIHECLPFFVLIFERRRTIAVLNHEKILISP